ncbi:hypothetical protein BGZ63DRAFT_504487 [Mariannaea sp. PMI_226]|nr:hypothetical protein BGZ63DRAFT_504487 [Mariannaea sp. PMI_226]
MTWIVPRILAPAANSLRCGLGLELRLGQRLGAGRRAVQFQCRLQSSNLSKTPGITPKAAVAKSAISSVTGATAGATTGATDVATRPKWERLGNPFTRAVQAYGRSQRARPYLTQIWSAIAIYLGADLSAQYLGENDYDPARTARNLIIGGIAAIPYYKYLTWLSKSFNYSSRWLSLGAKIVFNQVAVAPVFGAYYFGSQALLSGNGVSSAIERIKRTLPAIFINAAKFWSPSTAFSVTFVPIEYRAIFAGCVAIVWQTYLSFMNRQAELLEERTANLKR